MANTPPPAAPPEAIPIAIPVEGGGDDVPMALPVAVPVPAAFRCPACAADGPRGAAFCGECGYCFSAADLQGGAPGAAPAPATRLNGRYDLGELISDRLGVRRYRATDRGADGTGAVAVVVIQEALPLPAAEPVKEEAPAEVADTGEMTVSLDEPPEAGPTTQVLVGYPPWPSIAWERRLLRTLEHPALPAERDYFTDDEHEYLVEEVPAGRSLWDVWDDPELDARTKFGHLIDLAEALHRLHQCNAMLEGLRPDIVVIDEGGVRLTDISDLLPLPLPIDAPVRGGAYSAPELLSGHGAGDPRSDLYSFGAMLYALHVGRELNERTDFDAPGVPKPFIPRFPDIHPAFGRLMTKTFRREVEARFPTDEAGREDATGFRELIRTLEVLKRTYDNVRLEIAAWTSTGIVRTGNEDAFALLHAAESRQDDLGEAALVLLCDGMGGYEAGEVAAALTISSLRQSLTALRPFAAAAGASPLPGDPLAQAPAGGHAAPPLDVPAALQAIKQALRDANKAVFAASRAPGARRRGMGCTAEAVFLDGQNVVVGHVGDSRTYHLHEGRLIQLTRDQTLVNRLVELGTLSAEEAETHPRRNELQQAIGGQPDVEPGLYHGRLVPGDWVIVCSDGLTNHVKADELKQMLQAEATSAEMAARRLVNLTLIEGASDNVTVVAIRAT